MSKEKREINICLTIKKLKKGKKIMAKTPVSMTIDGYKEREVLMVTYEFNQATDVEGQMAGIPRGGKITVRVKALNDGTPDLHDRAQPSEERRDQVPRDQDQQGDEVHQVHQRLLHQLRGEVGGQARTLRGDRDHLQGYRVRQREVRERLGIKR